MKLPSHEVCLCTSLLLVVLAFIYSGRISFYKERHVLAIRNSFNIRSYSSDEVHQNRNSNKMIDGRDIKYISRSLAWGDPPQYNEFYDKHFEYAKKQTFLLGTWKVRDLRSNPSITYFPFPIKEDVNDMSSMIDYDSKLGLNSSDSESDLYNGTSKEDIVMISQLGQFEVYKISNRGHEIGDWDLIQNLKGIEMIRYNNSKFEEGYYFEGGDARYFQYRGKPYIAFTTLDAVGQQRIFRMNYAEMKYNYDDGIVYFDLPAKKINIDDEFGTRHEKNWSPFEHIDDNGVPRLLFIQNTFPHRIVHANETDERYQGRVLKGHTICSTQFVNQYWPYGEPRGGTPAVLVNTKYGKKYLTFFHSSGKIVMNWLQTYFFGAYLFDADPPFAISHIVPHPIMPMEWYNQDISGWAFKAMDYIVFPMGFIIRNGTIFMTAGRNDKQGWILKMDLDLLIDYLVPVAHDANSILLNKYKEHMERFEYEYRLTHRNNQSSTKH